MTSSQSEKPTLEIIVLGENISISGEEFRARVARAASGFRAAGVAQGDCVALLLRNDTPFLEATFAAQRLGAYAVPLNWHAKADEVGYIVNDCAAKVLVAHADLLTPEVQAKVGSLACIVADAPQSLLAAYKSEAAGVDDRFERWDSWLRRWNPFDGPIQPAPSSLIYSSGTTGRPKGVRRPPPDAEQFAKIEEMRHLMTQMDAEAIVLVPAPLYHSAPNMFGLRAARLAKKLIMPWRFDAEALLRDIEAYRVSHLYVVPTMFHRLLALPETVRERYDLSSLRFVLHAGGPCPRNVKRSMIQWLGPIIHEYYGSTDVGPVTFSTSAEWLANPGTVGRVMPGVQLEILDEQGNNLPPGEEGEICARVSFYPDFTYLGQPEARAKVQRGDLLATGDMGWVNDEGYLFLTDRKIDMIVSGGVNIYPAEVEAALLQVEGVADCAVFGVPDPEFSEAVAAVVQPQPGVNLTAQQVQAALKQMLASFKVPKTIEFLESLPREETGKIRKRALRDPYWVKAGRRI